jgi:hypothetical protein
MLAEGPGDLPSINAMVGKLKRASSHAIRATLPGKVWASGGKPIAIRDRSHQLEVFKYIQDHSKQGAWIWRFDQGVSPSRG